MGQALEHISRPTAALCPPIDSISFRGYVSIQGDHFTDIIIFLHCFSRDLPAIRECASISALATLLERTNPFSIHKGSYFGKPLFLS